jgi:hypothetical protein
MGPNGRTTQTADRLVELAERRSLGGDVVVNAFDGDAVV